MRERDGDRERRKMERKRERQKRKERKREREGHYECKNGRVVSVSISNSFIMAHKRDLTTFHAACDTDGHDPFKSYKCLQPLSLSLLSLFGAHSLASFLLLLLCCVAWKNTSDD